MPAGLMPFRQFVVKVHSRCDLACDHCYMYEHADQSWRLRDKLLSLETAALVGERIAEHAAAHDLDAVRVVLHGGEPLLAGAGHLEEVIGLLRAPLGDAVELDLRIHTNAVRLDEEFCDMFVRQGVRVGVSLDGDRAANDRHRRYADGRTSHPQVLRGLALLRRPEYRSLYSGILCTIDIANDPIAVYEALAAEEPLRTDLLLPHATWDAPPPGLAPDRDRAPGDAAADTPYADWLIRIHERWVADGRPFGIRIFESVESTLRGGPALTEALGLEPSDVLVIETDGEIEQVDSLKTAFAGAPTTGLNVAASAFDEAALHPGVRARQQGLAGLCDTCRACPVVASCGGGLYPHRYRSGSDADASTDSGSGSGFDNPTVYCDDLFKLVRHIEQTTGPAMATEHEDPRADDVHGPRHEITPASLRELAHGFGGTAAIAELADAQQSVNRLLLVQAAQVAIERDASLAAAWELLAALDAEQHRSALARVLSHPYFRAWAVRLIGAPGNADRGGSVTAGASVGADADVFAGMNVDAGHLAAIAMSAAVYAGVDAELRLPVRGGAVCLPTLGRLVLTGGGQPDSGPGRAGAIVTAGQGRIAITAADGLIWSGDPLAQNVEGQDAGDGKHESEGDRQGEGESPAGGQWQPVAVLRADGIAVRLEDTDPERDCHQWPVTGRLGSADLALWRAQFAEAWRLIRRDHSPYAAGLASGWSTLTPLAPHPQGREISATARQAFGTLAAALPASADRLALLAVHEFQHVKLGAVLDLYELFDESDTRRYYAPWRDDLRPLEGLLQGTYAHIAVTDFWRVRRSVTTGEEARAAEVQFARWRAHTSEAVEVLDESGSLTALGREFAEGMRATVTPWLDEAVRPESLTAAQVRSERHRGAVTGS